MDKVTNKDIARRAGVSQAAVSMALHGKKGISEATRSHILRIARELNYEPPVRSQPTVGPMALLVHPMQDRLVPPVLDGLLRRAAEENVELKILTLPQVLENPRGCLGDCSFLVTFDQVERTHLNHLATLVPDILVIDGNYTRKPFWNIRIDYAGAAYALTRHLNELGHRSFIYLNEELPSEKNIICFSGFQRRILEEHLPLNPAQIVMDAAIDRNVWSHLPDLIRAHNTSAVVCTSDQTAVRVVDQLTAMGYRVPEDVSVAAIVGQDNIAHPVFSLTRVSLNEDQMAQQVFLTTAQRRYSALAADTVIAPSQVIEGSSTAPPKFNPADKTLAIALYLKDHPTMRVARAGFLDSVRRLGYKAKVVGTADGDDESFAEAVHDLLRTPVDGVALWLTVPQAMEEVAAAGIPMVCLHSPIDNRPPAMRCSITEDPAAVAREVAEFFIQHLQSRTGSVAIVQSGDNLLETTIVQKCAQLIAASCPGIQVLSNLFYAAHHTEENVRLVTEFVEQTPDLLGVFVTAGDACANWAAAKKALGRSDLIVVGTDYTDESVSLLESGEIQAFVAQPVYEETQTSVEALDAILRGNEFPSDFRLEAPLVTVDKVEKYRMLLQEVRNWYV